MSAWGYVFWGGLTCTLAIFSIWKSGQLDAERAAHEATRAALEQAISACEQAEQRAEALRRALMDAHEREAAWTDEEAARAEIVRKAENGPRPPEDKDRVVDDATRRAAVSRLNVGW